ncbi:MAG: hypothetical protein JW889_15450 [Verrucomicrobia bacterium]|nr:hypothetical protein [Verrucomicrobiota bacterium]
MVKQYPDRLVTIGQFQSVAEAELARAILEATQIPAIVADLNTRLLVPQAVMYVQLQVRAGDARHAVQCLCQESDQHPKIEGEIANLPTCPACGSYDVTSKRPSWPLLIVSALFMFIPLFARRIWHCKACDHTWRA